MRPTAGAGRICIQPYAPGAISHPGGTSSERDQGNRDAGRVSLGHEAQGQLQAHTGVFLPNVDTAELEQTLEEPRPPDLLSRYLCSSFR